MFLQRILPMICVLLLSLNSWAGGGQKASAEIKVGDPAPQIEGIADDATSLSLASLYKQGLVLVYFYPKADTSGCTAQACSLRDAYESLQKKGVTVVGVSTDSVEAQKKFREKHRLPFRLVSDEDKKWVNAFQVPTTLGFAARQAFLIKDGKIIWLDRKASTSEQAADVLKVLESI